MKKSIDTLDLLTEKLSTTLHFIAAIAMFFWPFVMVLYVILRYFGINWLFVEEYTRYWQILIVFFALAYTFRMDKHIKVDLLVDRFPQKIRKLTKIIVLFLTFFVTIYLIIKSIDFTRFGIISGVRSITTQAPLWPVYLLIPIGLFSFNLEIFVQMLKELKSLFGKN